MTRQNRHDRRTAAALSTSPVIAVGVNFSSVVTVEIYLATLSTDRVHSLADLDTLPPARGSMDVVQIGILAGAFLFVVVLVCAETLKCSSQSSFETQSSCLISCACLF